MPQVAVPAQSDTCLRLFTGGVQLTELFEVTHTGVIISVACKREYQCREYFFCLYQENQFQRTIAYSTL